MTWRLSGRRPGPKPGQGRFPAAACAGYYLLAARIRHCRHRNRERQHHCRSLTALPGPGPPSQPRRAHAPQHTQKVIPHPSSRLSQIMTTGAFHPCSSQDKTDLRVFYNFWANERPACQPAEDAPVSAATTCATTARKPGPASGTIATLGAATGPATLGVTSTNRTFGNRVATDIAAACSCAPEDTITSHFLLSNDPRDCRELAAAPESGTAR